MSLSGVNNGRVSIPFAASRSISAILSSAWRRGRRRRSHGSSYAIANRRARGLGKPETFDYCGIRETAEPIREIATFAELVPVVA
jgi:hypothetical protein